MVEVAAEPDEAGREHTIREAADVVYHLMVLLAVRGVKLDEVEAELARRFGMSGLEEKASRTIEINTNHQDTKAQRTHQGRMSFIAEVPSFPSSCLPSCRSAFVVSL